MVWGRPTQHPRCLLAIQLQARYVSYNEMRQTRFQLAVRPAQGAAVHCVVEKSLPLRSPAADRVHVSRLGQALLALQRPAESVNGTSASQEAEYYATAVLLMAHDLQHLQHHEHALVRKTAGLRNLCARTGMMQSDMTDTTLYLISAIAAAWLHVDAECCMKPWPLLDSKV